MTVHHDEPITADTPELVGDRQVPGSMVIEVEFSPDDVERLWRGMDRHARVTRFIKNAALAEADRLAELAERENLAQTD